MNLANAFAQINWFAVVAASLATFFIGGLRYSKILFAGAWMKANSLNAADVAGGNKGKIFGLSFVLLFIAAIVLAMFLGSKSTLVTGILAGALVGVGWVATSQGVIYLFERKPGTLFAINAGYLVITFVVMGAILGAWH
jgi:Protein of unknown function (DUF1761)